MSDEQGISEETHKQFQEMVDDIGAQIERVKQQREEQVIAPRVVPISPKNLKKTKLFLYTRTRLKQLRQQLRTHVTTTWRSESAQDAKRVAKWITGYGILGWTILYTFFGYTFNPLYVLGAGALLYLTYDFIDYIEKRIRGGEE